MAASVKTYNSKLGELRQQFNTLLGGRYRAALIASLEAPTSANWAALERAEVLRDSILRSTFILTSKIYYTVDTYNNKSRELDVEVKALRVKVKRVENKLKAAKGRGLAAVPHKKAIRYDMVTHYFYLGYYTAAILGGSYFIYKKTKS